MGDRRAGAGRQGRRHGTQHRVAGRLGREVRRRAAAATVGRHGSRSRLRRGETGARPLRAPGHRGEQRRLRPVRVRRGTVRARRTGPDRDQRVRRPVGHPGRAAVPARAAQRPHHPGLLDRRHHRVSLGRHVPRVEVGAGGLLAGAGPGGRAVRRARHVDRTGRLRHRLGGPVGQARRSDTGLRRGACRCRGRTKPAVGQPGRPSSSAAALLKVVDAEEPPLRVFFGASPLQTAKADYESRLRNWEQWQPVAELAQG